MRSFGSRPIDAARFGPSTPMTPTSDAADARCMQRPAHLAVAADRAEALAELADRLVDRPADDARLDRRPAARTAGRTWRASPPRRRRCTTTSTTDGPATVTSSGPRNAKPTANDAWSVRLKIAHRRLELRLRDDARDHRRLGRGQDDGRQADPQVEDEEHGHVRAGQREPEQVSTVRIAFGTIIATRTSSRSTSTPPAADSRVGRDEERQDEGADRGVRAGGVEDQDRQRVERHVAADLGRRLDEPQAGEHGVAQDRGGSLRCHRAYRTVATPCRVARRPRVAPCQLRLREAHHDRRARARPSARAGSNPKS